MRKSFILCALAACVAPCKSFALFIEIESECTSNTCATGVVLTTPANCVSYEPLCASASGSLTTDVSAADCTQCESGYSLTTNLKTGSQCSITYHTCTPSSSGGTTCSVSSSGCSGGAVNDVTTNCQTTRTECFGGKTVQTCTSCASGFSLTAATATIDGCSNTYSYQNCTKPTIDITCSDCESDADWSVNRNNIAYEQKTTRVCRFGNCDESTEYRCAVGYYGSSTNGTSGCTKCPSSGGSVAFSDPGNNSAITDCYASGGSDETGTYSFTSQCHYSL